jgi:serine O-acetyltransferase
MSWSELPSPLEVAASVRDLRELLFPGLVGGTHLARTSSMAAQVQARLCALRVRLTQQIFLGIHHRCPQKPADRARCERKASSIADHLLAALPALRRTLLKDVRAAFAGDPAATSADEVVFTYPGIAAMCSYRIAHHLYKSGALIVPRMITELAHSETGIDIHPAASIGEAFFIDHGTGVVIGETSIIGNRVRIYQGVTLGAMSLPTGRARALSAAKRHPTIEDDVIIYANATILGGDTVIGRGAVIGGNSWITESVPEKARRSL